MLRDINILSTELEKVLHFVGKINITNYITSKSGILYSRKVVIRLNDDEPKSEGQKNLGKLWLQCQESATRGQIK